jgi:hypothetical protein
MDVSAREPHPQDEPVPNRTRSDVRLPALGGPVTVVDASACSFPWVPMQPRLLIRNTCQFP